MIRACAERSFRNVNEKKNNGMRISQRSIDRGIANYTAIHEFAGLYSNIVNIVMQSNS